MKKTSLQQRLTFLVLGLYVITFMIAFMYIIKRNEVLVINQNTKLYRHLTETLAISITNALLYQELEFLEEGGLIENYIDEWMGDDELNVHSIHVVDTKGIVIASNNLREYGSRIQNIKIDNHNTQVFTTRSQSNESLLEISTPLNISTRSWGNLVVKYSLRPLKRQIEQIRLEYIFLFLPLSSIVLVILWFYIRKLFKPLEDLRNFVDRVPEESWFRAPVNSNDEIGKMASTFNEMLDELETVREQEREAQEKFHQSERVALTGKLAAGVAHEIRNPIAGIENLVQNLEKYKYNDVKFSQYVETIISGLHRIEKIIAGLLSLSHHTPFNPEKSNIVDIIEDTVELVNYNIRKNSIIIDWDITNTIEDVYLDGDQIRQVLLNVILNSIQAMEDGGKLTFHLRMTDDEMLELAVEDNGIGIPTENLPKIFDPFFTTQKSEKGNGLGLAVSRNIINRHNGTIHIKSIEGKGAIVTILLPVNMKQEKSLHATT